jgi:aspartyl protease family protein
MAIGFMRVLGRLRSLDCKWPAAALRNAFLAACLAAAGAAPVVAADVSVIGVFPGKGAVLVVDGGAPQSVRIGQKVGGVTLVSVDKAGAVFEDAGRRRSVPLGQHLTGSQPATGRAPQVTLSADTRGQFLAESSVNGQPMRFMVDTGATLVSLPGNDARRLGIDFAKGQKGVAQTANGPAPVYRIKLDSVKVGEIELLNVDAIVLDGGGLAQPLLGMSFLNRVEMRREGDSMTLVRRF